GDPDLEARALRGRRGGMAGGGATQRLAGVGETGLDVLRGDGVVLLLDLLLAVAAGQEVDDKLDGDPSPLDHWFPDQDLRIHGNAFMPVHEHLQWGQERVRSSASQPLRSEPRVAFPLRLNHSSYG